MVNRYRFGCAGYLPIGNGEGNTTAVWSPENMSHWYAGKVSGGWGTPMVIPVLNDICAFRELEEHTIILMHTYTIPVYQYKVGTTEIPVTAEELDAIEAIIDSLPTSGAIVISQRHEAIAIGKDNEELDVNPYLKYFRDRVLAGLGMSNGRQNRQFASVMKKSSDSI